MTLGGDHSAALVIDGGDPPRSWQSLDCARDDGGARAANYFARYETFGETQLRDMKTTVLEVLGAALIVGAWVLAALTIPTLPGQVPTHFDFSGRVDRTGPTATLWWLPVIVSVSYLIVGATQLVPARLLNYPVKVTDRNRDGVYALGREMLPALKVCTLLTMFAVEWGTIDSATRGTMSPFFNAAVWTPVGLLFAVMIGYSLRMRAV